jgi:hypothetical protein
MFVAVGGNDSFVNEERVTMILTSPDGTNWTPRVSQPGKSLYAVAHATDHFVAVGQEGLAMTSTDGFVWSVSDTLGVWSFVDVTRFHDRFVALGNSWINGPSVIYSSSDGEQWQFEAEITSYGQMRCLASYGDGLLTAGEAGKAFISSNLKEWAKYDLPRGQDMFGAEVIGTESFFVGARGTLLSGESGSEWRVRPRDLGAHVFPGTAFGGGRFVTVTSTGKGFYSDDGVTWTASTMPTNLHLNRVTYGAGKFVAVGLGDSIVISTNGQSWHLVLGDGGFGDELNDVTWDGKHFLSIADSGLTFTSEDGLSWQSHDARGLGDFWCVTSGGGLFVAYRGSSIYTSIDAVNWIAQTNNINHQILIAGAYGQGRFVLVGDGGDAWTSTNGYHWTATNILQYWTLSDVVFAGDRFVTAGIGGYVFSSKDGSTWEVHLAPGPPQIFSLAFGRDTVVAAGAGMLFQSDPLHEAVRTVRGVRKLADGKLRLSLLGLPGSIYDLQMSHDLNEWESLDVLFAPSGRLTFDIDASGQATYYRAANALLRPSLRP